MIRGRPLAKRAAANQTGTGQGKAGPTQPNILIIWGDESAGRDGQPVPVKLLEVDLVDDKPGKPVGIQTRIERRPIVALGKGARAAGLTQSALIRKIIATGME
jgi:hypothetical protein